MATVAELLVKISANSSELRKELNASKRQLARFQKEMPSIIPNSAGTALLAVGAAMGAAGVSAIKLAADMEQTKIAFTTMLGSAENANKMIKELADFAAKTPFEFNGLINSSKKLLAFGFQAQEIIPMMTSIGDAVSAVGGSAQTLDQVTLAFGQMRTKGMVSAQEMNQLANAGLPAWEMLAKVIGKDIPTAMSLAEKKALNANVAIESMLQEMTTRYGGMMEKQSATVTGQLSNIQDIATQTAITIGEQLTEALELKDKLSRASDELEKFSEEIKNKGIGKALRELVPDQVIVASMTAVVAYSASRFVPALAAVRTALIEARLAALAFNTALGPVGWAITGATLIYTEYYLAVGQANEEAARAAALKRDLASLTVEERKEQEKLNQVIFDGASRMHLAGDKAGTLSNELTGVGDSAYYAANAMNALNQASMGDFKKLEYAPSSAADFKKMEDTNTLPPVKTSVDVVSILSGGSGKGGSGKSKASQELDKLLDKAEQIHKSLRSEWITTTQTERQQLELWKKDQDDALKETAAANKNYQDDLVKVEEIYSDRRLKILLDEVKEKIRLQDIAANTMRDLYKRQEKLKLATMVNSEGGEETSRVSLEEFNINSDFADQIDEIQKKYRDWISEYDDATDKQKEHFREAWTDNGIHFKETYKEITEINQETGEIIRSDLIKTVDFTKQIKKEEALAEKEKLSQIKALNLEYARWKESLDSAYNAGNVSGYQALLTNERAALEESLSAQQSLMDTYHDAMLAKNASTATLIAGLYAQGLSGLTTTFSDILSGTESIEDAFRSLGQTMIKVVTDYYAAKLAGMLMVKLMGEKGAAGQLSSDTAAGAATAAAWIPAAIARSLATAGGNAGPAMAGMAAATAAGMAMASISGFATGGQVTGPGTGTSDSILARLSHGEYVIKAAAARAIGTDYLDSLNQGRIPGFANGGFVAGPSLESLSVARHIGTSINSQDFDSIESEGSQRQATSSQPIIIQALDGKSVERWLENSGGRKIEKYLTKRAREFAPVRG